MPAIVIVGAQFFDLAAQQQDGGVRFLPLHGVYARSLAALALTMPGLLLPVACGFGRMARAQEVGPLPGEQPKMPREREFDDAEVERLFREYERLMAVREPTQMQSIPREPRTSGSGGRLRGDFWRRGEF
jgi:hypothetical protein